MPQPTKLKKSESLEIRIPYPTKLAFMARCREENRSASDVLRAMIADHLDAAEPQSEPAAARPPRRWVRGLAGALIAALVGAAAVPSLARPSLRAEFDRLDLDHDGKVSADEFSNATWVDIRFEVRPRGFSPAGARAIESAVAADQAIRTVLVRREFQRVDADHDGRISFEEYRGRYAPPPAPGPFSSGI